MAMAQGPAEAASVAAWRAANGLPESGVAARQPGG